MIIPDHFQVKNKFITGSGMNMKLKANGKKIGDIIETHIITGRQFELINTHKDLIAIARKYATQYGTVYEVFDELNNKLGSMERHIYSSPSKSEKYIIRNAAGIAIAQTQQLTDIRNLVDIFDGLNIKICEMRHNVSKFSKNWDVHLFGNFDRRLLVFIPLFVENQKNINCIKV